MLTDGLQDAFSGENSGGHTEDLVTRAALIRADHDAFAARSQQRFARSASRWPIRGRNRPRRDRRGKGKTLYAADETPRPDIAIQTLAELKPAFRPGGNITTGNSGAAAMVVAQRGFAEANGIEPYEHLIGDGVAALEPGLFSLGPVPAERKALDRAGWSLGDIDRIEINEAFAAFPPGCHSRT